VTSALVDSALFALVCPAQALSTPSTRQRRMPQLLGSIQPCWTSRQRVGILLPVPAGTAGPEWQRRRSVCCRTSPIRGDISTELCKPAIAMQPVELEFCIHVPDPCQYPYPPLSGMSCSPRILFRFSIHAPVGNDILSPSINVPLRNRFNK